jgi:hypothetical protein
MRIFEVNNMGEYVTLFRMLGEGLSSNYMGEEIPMYNDVTSLAYDFDFDFEDLFDEYGEPTFECGTINQIGDIPQAVFERELSKRLVGIEMDFPLLVAVDGEESFDRTGNTSMQIFHEMKKEEIIKLGTKNEEKRNS